MSSTDLIQINGWARPWESLLAAANLGDVHALGSPNIQRSGQGMFADFLRARRQFHLQLVALGAAHWNNWAAEMQKLDRGLRGSRNEASWAAMAHVDFSGETFPYELDVATLYFPGAFSLTQSRLNTYFTATGMQVFGTFHGAGALFVGDAAIDQCIFHGPVLAHDTKWRGRIEARGTIYKDEVRLRGAHFAKDVWFSNGSFSKLADFTGAHFASDAGFGRARFGDTACFDAVAFDDTLGMEACCFSAALTFRKANFAKRLFLRDAIFAEEPVIDGAQFSSAPVLDGAQFPDAASAPAAHPSIRRISAND